MSKQASEDCLTCSGGRYPRQNAQNPRQSAQGKPRQSAQETPSERARNPVKARKRPPLNRASPTGRTRTETGRRGGLELVFLRTCFLELLEQFLLPGLKARREGRPEPGCLIHLTPAEALNDTHPEGRTGRKDRRT